MYLFLDTETTGIDVNSDRIVSICWALYRDKDQPVASCHKIIYPNGFEIPSRASEIHGITTTQAREKGEPLSDVLTQLQKAIANHVPQLYVGHNVSFDRPLVLNEYRNAGLTENLSPLATYCTMKNTTDVCRIPSSYRGGYKWPKLEELHRHLFGRVHESAHDAEGDVVACANCFFELQARGMVGQRFGI